MISAVEKLKILMQLFYSAKPFLKSKRPIFRLTLILTNPLNSDTKVQIRLKNKKSNSVNLWLSYGKLIFFQATQKHKNININILRFLKP